MLKALKKAGNQYTVLMKMPAATSRKDSASFMQRSRTIILVSVILILKSRRGLKLLPWPIWCVVSMPKISYMVRIKNIVHYLEQIAPLAYQEGYDNAGLVVGDSSVLVTGVLICVDITAPVLQEAKEKNCNLIVAHHPIIFKPIYHLTGKDDVTRCITYAIKQDIAIYTLHTNLDNVAQGVNRQIAKTLGLNQLSILLPRLDILRHLTTFVPDAFIDAVLNALHAAGASHVGNGTYCNTVSAGLDALRPTTTEKSRLGTLHQPSHVEEKRVEVIFPVHLEKSVLRALQAAHPYEKAMYYIHKIKNTNPSVGAGMVGVLPQTLSSQSFLEYLKAKMHLTCMRHTAPIDRPIERVAVCGGSGSFLIQEAIRQQLDVLVTADVKYHDFFKAEGQMIIVDIGHYESEVGTKALIDTLLSEKFANIALLQCQTVTNPIHYL